MYGLVQKTSIVWCGTNTGSL